jgi:diacylglycerol kinase family enzyme
MDACTAYDPDSRLRFVITTASGQPDAEAKREVIEAALRSAGRAGELIWASPGELPARAGLAAAAAAAERGAVVAVGGEGTLTAVAQAAYTWGCAMGVVPHDSSNPFARVHGIATDPEQAAGGLMQWRPQPVQVGSVNGRLFLVDASLGLFPELLGNREACRARSGHDRRVALEAAVATVLSAHRRLRLRVELGGQQRDVQTHTLLVRNNWLQLDPIGSQQDRAPKQGRMAALILRPIGTPALFGLLLRGALGTWGASETVERFEFQRLVVRPWRWPGPPDMKVSCDGEIGRLRPPLEFGVAAEPLYLLKPATGPAI